MWSFLVFICTPHLRPSDLTDGCECGDLALAQDQLMVRARWRCGEALLGVDVQMPRLHHDTIQAGAGGTKRDAGEFKEPWFYS
jgi:hypothetical protein